MSSLAHTTYNTLQSSEYPYTHLLDIFTYTKLEFHNFTHIYINLHIYQSILTCILNIFTTSVTLRWYFIRKNTLTFQSRRLNQIKNVYIDVLHIVSSRILQHLYKYLKIIQIEYYAFPEICAPLNILEYSYIILIYNRISRITVTKTYIYIYNLIRVYRVPQPHTHQFLTYIFP